MNNQKFDIAIIGAGPGGYVAAIRAAQLGFKVACIDKKNTLGGTCLNEGCIPSKALLQSTEHYAFLANEGKLHGIDIQGLKINLTQMMKRKDDVVKSLVTGISGLFKKHQVSHFVGNAQFISSFKIQVTPEKNINNSQTIQEIEASHFILATGSEPISLPFLPFDEKVVLSSTGALSLSKIPKKMLVIGGGVIGVELASVFSRLGSKVTIFEMLPEICIALDKDIRKILFQTLKKQGLDFYLDCKVKDAKIGKESVSLTIEQENKSSTIEGDIVLVAVGRKPFTHGLGLEKIGIKTTAKGSVTVDQNFRTEVTNIFAIGDLIEGPMLAHRASEEGIAVVEMLAGITSHVHYISIPNVIYTHPEATTLGFTEDEARSANIDIKIGFFPFKANARARCAGFDSGLVKIIAEAKSGHIIGLHIVGPSASEMMGEGVLAINQMATLEDVAYASHAHPTYSEAIKEAALNALEKTIHL